MAADDPDHAERDVFMAADDSDHAERDVFYGRVGNPSQLPERTYPFFASRSPI
jgi:hypothetical protein